MSAEVAVAVAASALASAGTAVTVRVAHGEEDRARVYALRGRARPGGDAPLSDAFDRLPNATLLLAQSPFDGEALGTLRILAGDHGPMMIDGLLELPASFRCRSIAEGSRLVVRDGPETTQVRRILWKAFHRYCLAAQVQTMLVAARDAAAREYEWLGFTDVLPGGPLFAPRGHDRATHRLMSLDVFEARESMRHNGHPLHEFFFVERHPQIDLLGGPHAPGASRATPAGRSRRYAGPAMAGMTIAGLTDIAVV